MLEKILQSRVGIIIISLFWGLGLASLFRQACRGRQCYVIQHRGPDPEEVSRYAYQYGTPQCYRYQPHLTSCDAKPSP